MKNGLQTPYSQDRKNDSPHLHMLMHLYIHGDLRLESFIFYTVEGEDSEGCVCARVCAGVSRECEDLGKESI